LNPESRPHQQIRAASLFHRDSMLQFRHETRAAVAVQLRGGGVALGVGDNNSRMVDELPEIGDGSSSL
jgi:hypothetical protein